MTAPALAHRLTELVRGDALLMAALHAVRELGLPSWCIGAGAVRNLVWDHLHGHSQPSALADVDVAHFDPTDLRPERDAELQAWLTERLPGLPWEVVNQAAVHLWYPAVFGQAVGPLRSLEEGLASWPEIATAVGVCMHADDTLQVIAPLGLDDLFAMVVRHNPRRVCGESYRQRLAQKRFTVRWPQVRVLAP